MAIFTSIVCYVLCVYVYCTWVNVRGGSCFITSSKALESNPVVVRLTTISSNSTNRVVLSSWCKNTEGTSSVITSVSYTNDISKILMKIEPPSAKFGNLKPPLLFMWGFEAKQKGLVLWLCFRDYYVTKNLTYFAVKLALKGTTGFNF